MILVNGYNYFMMFSYARYFKTHLQVSDCMAVNNLVEKDSEIFYEQKEKKYSLAGIDDKTRFD